MKIAKDIYLVGDGAIRLSNPMDCHVYLIDGGQKKVLIDSGAGVEPEFIVDNIRNDGFTPGEVDYLIVTHCHADHAGGCKYFREELSCKILAPEVEGRFIEDGTEQDLGLDMAKRGGLYPADYVFPHSEVDHELEDSETIEADRYRLTAMHVPGHSYCPAVLLMKGEGYTAMFTDDVVFLGGTIGLGNWRGSSLENYRNSIGKLAGLHVEGMFPGHFLWTLRMGQEHLDRAIEALKLPYPPPNFQHTHPSH
jgi:glyoxylase-like metal-dependent hydrolase (beta-lactamase superfamily II)